jgi:cell division protein FtsN
MVSRQQVSRADATRVAPVVGTASALIDRQTALQRRLQWRMAAAGVAALLLLAALTFLDALAPPDDANAESPQDTYTAPVAVGKPPLKVAEPLVETLPVPTVVASQANGAAIEKAVDPAESPSAAQASADRTGGETSLAAARIPAELPRPASGHILQSGALPDRRQADELQARLAQEGIPATVETHLQVGPFRTRAEAEAARRKMPALGFAAPMTLGKHGQP